MIWSHAAPEVRVMVTKSLTPNTAATPAAAKTDVANAFPAADSALAKFIVAGNFESSVNFIASGFGVGEGVAVAIQ